MTALLAIGWFIALLLSLAAVFKFVGARSMVIFFPEGDKWWLLPAQLASVTVFAIVVLFHPFGS